MDGKRPHRQKSRKTRSEAVISPPSATRGFWDVRLDQLLEQGGSENWKPAKCEGVTPIQRVDWAGRQTAAIVVALAADAEDAEVADANTDSLPYLVAMLERWSEFGWRSAGEARSKLARAEPYFYRGRPHPTAAEAAFYVASDITGALAKIADGDDDPSPFCGKTAVEFCRLTEGQRLAALPARVAVVRSFLRRHIDAAQARVLQSDVELEARHWCEDAPSAIGDHSGPPMAASADWADLNRTQRNVVKALLRLEPARYTRQELYRLATKKPGEPSSAFKRNVGALLRAGVLDDVGGGLRLDPRRIEHLPIDELDVHALWRRRLQGS